MVAVSSPLPTLFQPYPLPAALQVRKGMVLVDERVAPKASWEFDAGGCTHSLPFFSGPRQREADGSRCSKQRSK